MKFVTSTILTALFSFSCVLFLPWWMIAIASFIVAIVVKQNSLFSFLTGFIALFLSWGIHALIIDSKNDHLLATKVSGILKLGESSFAIILLTAFIGGLIGGLGALTASYLYTNNLKNKGII